MQLIKDKKLRINLHEIIWCVIKSGQENLEKKLTKPIGTNILWDFGNFFEFTSKNFGLQLQSYKKGINLSIIVVLGIEQR
jgi:hypothetical protein